MTDEKLYLMAPDYGSGPDLEAGELYTDPAFAWTQADEAQAEDALTGETVTYAVYALTAVERT